MAPASTLILLLTVHTLLASAKVLELTQAELDSFREGKFFNMIFVDSPTCIRCRRLYPCFYQAAANFPNDPDISFARTHDAKLVEAWGIKELPAVVYFHGSAPEHELMENDISVDGIIDTVIYTMRGNFASMERKYAVEITPDNYDELIVTPEQFDLVLIYNKHHEDRTAVIEGVAKIFRNDDRLLVGKLNADKYEALRNKIYRNWDVPLVFWHHMKKSEGVSRFGGEITLSWLVTFVNEQTELWRSKDGVIMSKSGRIHEVDSLMEKNVPVINDANPMYMGQLMSAIEDIEYSMPYYKKDFTRYYKELLSMVGAEGHPRVLKTEMDNIEAMLYESGGSLTPRQADELVRMRNIPLYLYSLVQDYVRVHPDVIGLDGKRKKSKEPITLVLPHTRHEEL